MVSMIDNDFEDRQIKGKFKMYETNYVVIQFLFVTILFLIRYLNLFVVRRNIFT